MAPSLRPLPPLPWWSGGLPFQCTQCGECCRARGAYQFVYVGKEERRALARFLGLDSAAFTRRYTVRDPSGYRTLRFSGGACIFLRDNRCRVHPAKPVQCRTWPFWPELLRSRAVYAREVQSLCPGSRRGPRTDAAEIRRQMQETRHSEAADSRLK